MKKTLAALIALNLILTILTLNLLLTINHMNSQQHQNNIIKSYLMTNYGVSTIDELIQKKLKEYSLRYTGNPFTTALYPGQFQAENITGMHWYTYLSGSLYNRTGVVAFPEQTATFIIFGKDTDGDGTYDIVYAKNCTSGQIEFGGEWDAGGVDGANASAVIQAVIDALSSGGIVLIKAGTYTAPIATTVFVRKSNVRIIGEGMDATILGNMTIVLGSDTQGSDAPLIKDISVESLTINGTNLPDHGNGIGFRNVENAKVINVRFFAIPYWSIIGAFESGVPKSKSLWLINCIFDRNNVDRGEQDMTAFNNLENLYVINCRFLNNPRGSTFLPYNNVDNIYLQNLEFENCTDAHALSVGKGGSAGSIKNVYAYHIKLTNCSVDNFLAPSNISIIDGIYSDTSITIGGQYCSATNIIAHSVKIQPYGHNGTIYIAGKVLLENAIGGIEVDYRDELDYQSVSIRHCYVSGDRRIIVFLGDISVGMTVELWIENCYSNGGISLASWEPSSAVVKYVGGIRNCYTGNAYAGGLAGRIALGQQLGTIEKPFILENNFAYGGFEFTSTATKTNFIMRHNRAYQNPNTARTENSGIATVANGEYIVHGLAPSLNIGVSNSTVLITPYTTAYDGVPVVVGCDFVNATHIRVSVYWSNGTAITDDAIQIWWQVKYTG